MLGKLPLTLKHPDLSFRYHLRQLKTHENSLNKQENTRLQLFHLLQIFGISQNRCDLPICSLVQSLDHAKNICG